MGIGGRGEQAQRQQAQREAEAGVLYNEIQRQEMCDGMGIGAGSRHSGSRHSERRRREYCTTRYPVTRLRLSSGDLGRHAPSSP